MADVFVVDVHVNEAAQFVSVVIKVALKLGEFGTELIESLTGGGRFDLKLRLAAGKLSQGGGYCDRD